MGDDRPTTVLIADDEPMVRVGLGLVIDREPDLVVVGEAADGLEALEQAATLRPHVVVMDVRMPRLDGVEATRRLLSDDYVSRTGLTATVLMLTTFDDDDAVDQALRAGAAGFLLKSAAPRTLGEAIRALARGNGFLDPTVTPRLVAALAARPDRGTPSPAQMDALTPREREVLVLAALGLTNGAIAGELVVSEATVKTHMGHVLTKLGVHDRAQAVSAAFLTGLVTPGERPRSRH